MLLLIQLDLFVASSSYSSGWAIGNGPSAGPGRGHGVNIYIYIYIYILPVAYCPLPSFSSPVRSTQLRPSPTWAQAAASLKRILYKASLENTLPIHSVAFNSQSIGN